MDDYVGRLSTLGPATDAGLTGLSGGAAPAGDPVPAGDPDLDARIDAAVMALLSTAPPERRAEQALPSAARVCAAVRAAAAAASPAAPTPFPPPPRGAVEARLARLRARREALAGLLLAPGIPQRTAEWFERREGLVTASELDGLLTSPASYLARKRRSLRARLLGLPDPFAAVSRTPAVQWGVRYEAVVAAVYERRTGARLHEFGLLLHPTLDGLGASPDGITSEGVMLEIKCPYSRAPVPGQVPRGYMTQVLAQLDVAGLDECDFVECRLREYGSAAEFLEDAHPLDDSLTRAGLEKGATAYEQLSGQETETRLAPLGAGGAEVVRWAEAEAAKARAKATAKARAAWSAAPGPSVRYWAMDSINAVRVRRDPAFIRGHEAAILAAAATLRGMRAEELADIERARAAGEDPADALRTASQAAKAAMEEADSWGPEAAPLPRFAFLL